MPFCQYCGKQVDSAASFCPSCGRPIAKIEQSFSEPSQLQTQDKAPVPTGGVIPQLLELNEIVMKKRIISLREHYDFEDTLGNNVGQGDGNFFQLPAKFQVFDRDGNELMRLQGKLISFRNEFAFLDTEGKELGVIKKKIMKFFGDEYWIEQDGHETMRIFGNFTEHDYRMETSKDKVAVATVHKKWVAVRDSFGITISGPIDHRLVIGAVIAVEHEEVTEHRVASSGSH